MVAFERAWRVEVRDLPCPLCFAAPGLRCQTLSRVRRVSHLERVEEAYRQMLAQQEPA